MDMESCCDEDAQADEANAMAAERARMNSVSSSGISSTRTAAMPPTMLSLLNPIGPDPGLAARFQSGPFTHDMAAIRSPRYPPPGMLPSNPAPNQYAYPDGSVPLQPPSTTKLEGLSRWRQPGKWVIQEQLGNRPTVR